MKMKFHKYSHNIKNKNLKNNLKRIKVKAKINISPTEVQFTNQTLNKKNHKQKAHQIKITMKSNVKYVAHLSHVWSIQVVGILWCANNVTKCIVKNVAVTFVNVLYVKLKVNTLDLYNQSMPEIPKKLIFYISYFKNTNIMFLIHHMVQQVNSIKFK